MVSSIDDEMILAFIRLHTLKFKQMLHLDFDLAKALVPERTLVQYGDDGFSRAIQEWVTMRELDVNWRDKDLQA
jgi:hypothetical protein